MSEINDLAKSCEELGTAIKTQGKLVRRLLDWAVDADVLIESVRTFLNEPETIAGDPVAFLRRQLECYDEICAEQAKTNEQA